MKYLFFLGHPAHFHLFKNAIAELKKKGHKVFILIKKKDILEKLLIESGFEYKNVLPEGRHNSKLGIAWGVIKKDMELLKFCLKNRPDLMLGTSAEIAHIGALLKIPSFNFSEDDVAVIKTFAKLTYPFSDYVVSPVGCNNENWNNKTIFYDGYHKLAYLHPNWFKPDYSIVKSYFNSQRPYFLIRFSELSAHHDDGILGISDQTAAHIIDYLSSKGDVYITSERGLPTKYDKYKLNIKLTDIHHIMYYAQLYIGDSQSMAVEAAMLGTPSIRVSSFSGKISVLEELEHKYELTYGVKPGDELLLLNKVKELAENNLLRESYRLKRDNMLADKIDVTAFIIWLIENYPLSIQEYKRCPNLFDKFGQKMTQGNNEKCNS